MKRGILTSVLMALMCLIGGFGHLKMVTLAEKTNDVEEYLSKTGMPLWEIHALDSDVRQFIANDLRKSGEKEWKVNTDILALTTMNSEQYAAAFYISVYAFQAEADYRVYAVYESSAGIMMTGDDSLTLRLGDSFEPYKYGGQIWYKKAGSGRWVPGGGLSAGHQTFEGGTFAGSQLGNFRRKTLVKGCVCCYAHAGEGDGKQIVVEYIHNPPKEDGGIGVYVVIVAVTIIIVLILRGRE